MEEFFEYFQIPKIEYKEPLRIYKMMDKELKTYIENFEIWKFNMGLDNANLV